jgi:hypothetical protein
MSQSPQIDVHALWGYVTQQVKNQITLPSLWRALEAARPLTLEGDQLIIGFGAADAHQSGLLETTQNRNVIEQVMSAATRRQLRLRIIPGDTLADWELAKQKDVESALLQQQAKRHFLRPSEAAPSWDAVAEQLVRRFQDTPHRVYTSVQGRYLQEALAILAEAYARLMPDPPTDGDERNFSRALDRVSERTGVPASQVALMVYERVGKR